tara:strand:- start:461 stop:655 length:195 start_codon:yes stop_codon:yes gene_type:complete
MNMAFKDITKFDLIENGRITHYFRVLMVDDIVALCNNSGVALAIYNNNNNREVNNDTINKKDKG